MNPLDMPYMGDLGQVRAVHFVGVGGAGMNALARVLLDMGIAVSGSDLKATALTAELQARGAIISEGHRADAIAPRTELVVVSSAVPGENPELAEAARRGLPVIKRAALLGALMRRQPTVAVAGTHGKTTTSSMLAVVLDRLSLDPTFVLGGESIDLGTNGRAGKGPFLVAEADEFDGSLRFFRPQFAIVTNIEPEHLDYYGSEAALLDAFRAYLTQLPATGFAILGIDDPNVAALEPVVRAAGVRVVSYGFSQQAEVRPVNLSPNARFGFDFHIERSGSSLARVSLGVPGRHNVLNASAVMAFVDALDLGRRGAAQILGLFSGAKRRLEVRGEAAGVTVVDTYAHHPTEIRADLAALRQRFGHHPVVALFQPHLFSRTRLLMDQFATAFDDADRVFVYDIYPAREENRWDVSAQELVERLGSRATYAGPLSAGGGAAADACQPGGCAVVMGAGDIDRLVPELLDRLGQEAAP